MADGFNEYNKFHEVLIIRVENRWIVKVGCKTFVSQRWSEISDWLERYYKDPKKVFDDFYNAQKGEVNG
jgi:hypothetical protein